MRTCVQLAVAVVASCLSLESADISARAQRAAPAGQWPPPGVTALGGSIVPPRVVHEVRPTYTAAAMRAGIQGNVVLDCVVDTTGAVTAVRVRRSLDAAYGLDDAAVAALQQWRFTPATLDGKPVAVLITVDLTFSIRDRATALEPQWPKGFEAATQPSADWIEERATTDTFELRVSVPRGWTVRTDSPARRLMHLQSADDVQSVTIARPLPAPFALTTPIPGAQLQELIDRLKVLAGSSAETLATGQAKVFDRPWVWVEQRLSATDAPDVPAAVRATLDSARMWTFATTSNGQLLALSCTVLIPRVASEDERQRHVTAAGAIFGAIVRRLAIEARRG